MKYLILTMAFILIASSAFASTTASNCTINREDVGFQITCTINDNGTIFTSQVTVSMAEVTQAGSVTQLFNNFIIPRFQTAVTVRRAWNIDNSLVSMLSGTTLTIF